MIQQLYIIPSFDCNLKCPHCFLRLRKEDFNEVNFFNSLHNTSAYYRILFGGECTLHFDRFKKCLETGLIDAVSTNLLNLSPEILELYKEYEIALATSWNPQRFNEEQYKLWVENLRKLEGNDLDTIVLITLTEDLLSYDLESLYNKFDCWNSIKSVKGILFEFLVDDNSAEDLNERADLWLCRVYKDWRWNNIENIITESLGRCIHNCNSIYTLEPDGIVRRGCPMFVKAKHLEKCLSCELADKCNPCVLKNQCSFPKNLSKLVEEDKLKFGEK